MLKTGGHHEALEEGRRRVEVYNSNMPVKNIVTNQNMSSEKRQLAHDLRGKLTPAEKVLWQELRGNKVGSHFTAS